MPPIRFRIRTIMIVIAALAVLMGLFMNLGLVVTTTIVFLVGSLAEFSAFSFYLWHGRTKRAASVRRAK
jgi:hypothetical protein